MLLTITTSLDDDWVMHMLYRRNVLTLLELLALLALYNRGNWDTQQVPIRQCVPSDDVGLEHQDMKMCWIQNLWWEQWYHFMMYIYKQWYWEECIASSKPLTPQLSLRLLTSRCACFHISVWNWRLFPTSYECMCRGRRRVGRLGNVAEMNIWHWSVVVVLT